jgi:hypothetical protein
MPVACPSFLLTCPADFFLAANDQSRILLYCVKNQELRVSTNKPGKIHVGYHAIPWRRRTSVLHYAKYIFFVGQGHSPDFGFDATTLA